jgi:hypothetical protein
MSKWKERLDEIMADYMFDEREAGEAFEFVAKVVGLEVDRLEADEPYATETIHRTKQMESELQFDNFVEALRDEN